MLAGLLCTNGIFLPYLRVTVMPESAEVDAAVVAVVTWVAVKNVICLVAAVVQTVTYVGRVELVL